MAQSTKEAKEAASVDAETNEERTQAHYDWLKKREDFHNGNPSAEEIEKWEEENGAHPCKECNGTGIAGGPPPKPLLRVGKEGVVTRAARTHSESEFPPVEKAAKKEKTEDDKK